jgi:hypothetical protein
MLGGGMDVENGAELVDASLIGVGGEKPAASSASAGRPTTAKAPSSRSGRAAFIDILVIGTSTYAD